MSAETLDWPSTSEYLTERAWERGSATTTFSVPETLTGRVASTRRKTYRTPRGTLTLELRGEPPVWLMPTTESLVGLLSLGQGWNSYGARPVDPLKVVAALELLAQVMSDSAPAPTVVPTSRGGVQLEWHTLGIDLEVEVQSPQRFQVSFEDSRSNVEWEGELTLDMTPLAKFISSLSR